MRLKNMASQLASQLQPPSPAPLLITSSMTRGIFIGKSRGWVLDPFRVLGLNLDLSLRFKRLLLHPCCLPYPVYHSLSLEQGSRGSPSTSSLSPVMSHKLFGAIFK